MLLKSLTLILLGLIWSNIAQTQESINPVGGDASGSGGSVAFSIGQVAYTTNLSDAGSSAQGVQQAYEIFKLGSGCDGIDIAIITFPNPTTNNVTVLISSCSTGIFYYRLFDMQGKLISRDQIQAGISQIKMTNLPAATYILNIATQDYKKNQSIKIIKTK
jgi:hypothetical protein